MDQPLDGRGRHGARTRLARSGRHARAVPSASGRPDRLVVAAAVLLVILGYLAGSHGRSIRDLTGPAYVGDREVTMTFDGVSYGFSDSMPWIDPWGPGTRAAGRRASATRPRCPPSRSA
jgi:hypothetical protein